MHDFNAVARIRRLIWFSSKNGTLALYIVTGGILQYSGIIASSYNRRMSMPCCVSKTHISSIISSTVDPSTLTTSHSDL